MIAVGLVQLFAPMGIGPNPIDDPSTPPGFDPNTVTPGVAGFVAIALVTLATIFLLVDMSRRIRRVRYRGEIRERLEAEQQQASLSTDDAAVAAAALPAEGRVDRDEEDGRPVA